MTADPIRTLTDDHFPTTSFAGQVPAALKPIDAANLAPLHADKPPPDVGPPVSNADAALVHRENAPSKAPPARPSAKSP